MPHSVLFHCFCRYCGTHFDLIVVICNLIWDKRQFGYSKRMSGMPACVSGQQGKTSLYIGKSYEYLS
jgi:hypothetical protein